MLNIFENLFKIGKAGELAIENVLSRLFSKNSFSTLSFFDKSQKNFKISEIRKNDAEKNYFGKKFFFIFSKVIFAKTGRRKTCRD